MTSSEAGTLMPDWIGAGSLHTSGTLTGTFSGDRTDALLRMLGLAEPPRHEVRFAFPEGADRHCPVCHEPAEAVVVEAVKFQSSSGVDTVNDDDGSVSWRLRGLSPGRYSVEPCGHQLSI